MEHGDAGLGHGPRETGVSSEVERNKGFVLMQSSLHIIDACRFRVGKVGVISKTLAELAPGTIALSPKLLDLLLQRLENCRITILRRQRERAIEDAQSCDELLVEILRAAREIRQSRVADRCARA